MSFSSDLLNSQLPHVAIFPSAGMGHLTPFLRLASLLLRQQSCRRLTLITANQTVSLAESRLISRFLSSFPQVAHVQFDVLPLDPSTVASEDPFWIHFEATRRSLSLLLAPLLSSFSPPLSAIVHDISLITPVVSIAESLSLPCYTLFPSSARMFSLFSYFPSLEESTGFTDDDDDAAALKIPGLVSPIARSSLPPLLLNPTTLFANIFRTDSPKLCGLDGVLLNTFRGIETDPVLDQPLNYGAKEVPLFPVGPFTPCEFESDPNPDPSASAISKWLDEQPEGAVVYVSFGSKTALSREQMKEVAKGLALSSCSFLWVVKEKRVDKEEDEGNVMEEMVGKEVMEIMKEKGLVVRNWVDQSEILGHKAVGGFVSHCGWNSVVESAWHGVRILAWPQNGDQKVNAEVVRESGIGMWVESWGWSGGEVVEGGEIGERIREMMASEKLRSRAANIGEKARKGGEVGGSRDKVFERLVDEWKKKKSTN